VQPIGEQPGIAKLPCNGQPQSDSPDSFPSVDLLHPGGVHSHRISAPLRSPHIVGENGLPSTSCAASHPPPHAGDSAALAFDFWLDCGNVDAVTAAALLSAPRENVFEGYDIATVVNRVANDRPALFEPIAECSRPLRFTPGMSGDPRRLR
jgi:hypothetical protein